MRRWRFLKDCTYPSSTRRRAGRVYEFDDYDVVPHAVPLDPPPKGVKEEVSLDKPLAKMNKAELVKLGRSLELDVGSDLTNDVLREKIQWELEKDQEDA